MLLVSVLCVSVRLQAHACDPAPVPELDTVPEILSWTSCAPTSNLFLFLRGTLTLQENRQHFPEAELEGGGECGHGPPAGCSSEDPSAGRTQI